MLYPCVLCMNIMNLEAIHKVVNWMLVINEGTSVGLRKDTKE